MNRLFDYISSFVGEYQEWYNNKRYNSGINDVLVNLHMLKNVTDHT